MLEAFKGLLNLKSLGLVATILASLTGLHTCHSVAKTDFEKAVTDKVTTAIQKEHNALIEKARAEADKKLKATVSEWQLKLSEAEEAKDKYWEGYYARDRADLISEYELKLEEERIKNDSSNIFAVLDSTTFRLYNEATSLVSRPAGRDYSVAESGRSDLITADTREISHTLLLRPYADPVGNNQRRRLNQNGGSQLLQDGEVLQETATPD